MGVTAMVILFLWVCSRSVRSSASQRQQWTALRSGSSPRSTPAERQGLPRCRRIGFRGSAISSNGATSASADRQPLPHRLPLRSIPPQRFACGSSHSRGTWSSTVCAEEFPTPRVASFAILQLLPGRVRRSCKSPRARILVLGTSGAHWPARWPQFVLTERVDKS